MIPRQLSLGDQAGIAAGHTLLHAISEVPYDERLQWWADVLMTIVECCEASVGPEHAQTLLCAVRAPGASVGN